MQTKIYWINLVISGVRQHMKNSRDFIGKNPEIIGFGLDFANVYFN